MPDWETWKNSFTQLWFAMEDFRLEYRDDHYRNWSVNNSPQIGKNLKIANQTICPRASNNFGLNWTNGVISTYTITLY